MIIQESRRVWGAIAGLIFLICMLVIASDVKAQTSEVNTQVYKENTETGGNNSQDIGLKNALAQYGRIAEFNTIFVPGGNTAEIILHVPYEQAKNYSFYVAAVDEGYNSTKFNVAVTDQSNKSTKIYVDRSNNDDDIAAEAAEIDVQGIDKIVKDEKALTRLIVSIPDEGWHLKYPRHIFYMLGYNTDGKLVLAATLSARVSNWYLSLAAAIGSVIGLYWVLVQGLRKNGIKIRNPIELTSGFTGRRSLSNLQTLFFTFIVVALLTYILVRWGILSDLSDTVWELLLIVGGGNLAARWTANRQLSSTNFKYLQDLGWLPDQLINEGKNVTLLSREGELDVTRMQALAFSLVVGAALIFRGVKDLAHFEVPEKLMTLLFASQAIYIGGKWVQPTGEQFSKLNELVDNLRELEFKVTKEAAEALVDAKNDSERQSAIRNAPSFKEYYATVTITAQEVARSFEIAPPTTDKFGIILDTTVPTINSAKRR